MQPNHPYMSNLKKSLGFALIILIISFSCTKQNSSAESSQKTLKDPKNSTASGFIKETTTNSSSARYFDNTMYDTVRNVTDWQAHEDGLKDCVIQMGFTINSTTETWSHDSATLIIGIHFSGNQRPGDPGEIDGPHGRMQVSCGFFSASRCWFNNFSQAGAWMSGMMIGIAWFSDNTAVSGYVYINDNVHICARVTWQNFSDCRY
jgi:hypothetical protein